MIYPSFVINDPPNRYICSDQMRLKFGMFMTSEMGGLS